MAYGTALSPTQLNASASVPGTFVYTPAAGAILNAGANSLSLAFTPADTGNYKATTASTTVTVIQAVPSVSWTAPSGIVYGTALSSAQLNASATVPGTFTYTPAAGTVLPVGNNTLSVTFTPASTNYTSVSASTSITVTQHTQATPVLSWAVPSSIAYGTALTASQLNATASVPGTFVYAPAAGTMLGAGVSSLSVTFTPYDTANYKSATASTYVNVTQAVPALLWAPAGMVYGTALSGAQLNASANVPGSFAYTPAAGTVLNAGASTLQVTFTPADSNDYKPVTASAQITVSQATPVVMWPAPPAMVYGTALSGTQLNASANVPGIFSYTPGAGTILPVGTSTLSVTFQPTNATNYTSASASTSVSVAPAPQSVPPIAWSQPAGITYGTALSDPQLNATSSVAGSFAYSPAAGTVLNAGSNTLTVTFTPWDTTKYSVSKSMVTLPVAKSTPLLTWAGPTPIVAGTALSGAQLNASANVPGTFAYNPSAGTVLNAGTTTLGVTFTPLDTSNYNSQTAGVSLAVSAAPANVYLWLVSPSAGQTVSGKINAVAGMKLWLDAAGSFLIVDGRYLSDVRAWGAPYSYPLDTTTLTNGPHTIQVWAHDISNNVTITAPVVFTVAN